MKIAKIVVTVILLLFIAAALFIGNTRPIDDGDTWWHMQYGKYMLENKTLIPNHSLYTWTPASNDTVYCAWIPEIILYALYSAYGFYSLYAVKYALAVFALALFILYAIKRNVLTHPVSLFVILMGVITHGNSSGSMIKPELFTYVFMTIMVFLWYMFSLNMQKNLAYLYGIPVVILIWVNSHGGFIFAAPFFVCTYIGILLNYKFQKDTTVNKKALRHITIAWILSFLATFVTPYGYSYHLDLLQSALLKPDVENLKTVQAYTPTLAVPTFVLYFVIPIVILVYTLISTKRYRLHTIDWVFIVNNVMYAALYTIFARLIYYWIPVYVFSTLFYIKGDAWYYTPKKRWMPAVITAIMLLTGLDQLRWHTFINFTANTTWFGFGNSFINSDEEADFIAKYYPGYNIGNPYNCGGYFLWRMYPDNKIMIDPRYFPFKSWYNEYLTFASRQDVEAFMSKYPFDILHLQYMDLHLYPYFLYHPDWKVAFYGTGGIVFVKKHIPLPGNTFHYSHYIYSNPSLTQSVLILNFLARTLNWQGCELMLQHMQKEFTWSNQKPLVEAANTMYNGVRAFYHRDYAKANELFEKTKGRAPIPANILSTLYHYKAVDLWTQNKIYDALDYTRKVLELNYNDEPYATFNIGVINWYIYKQYQKQGITGFITQTPVQKNWMEPLQQFLKQTAGNPKAKPARDIANAIINGTYSGDKPPLLYPPEPAYMP